MIRFLKRHILKRRPSKHKKVEIEKLPIPESLRETSLYSTIVFVLGALLIQFLITFQTRLFLRYFSISFTYNLFGIRYSTVSADAWPEDRVFLVYGFGMLLYFLFGILLLFLLKKFKRIPWKPKLILTWFAFLLIHTLPVGMLYGVFLFDGFGYAYSWLVGSMIIRGILAVIALSIAIYNRTFWTSLFIKASSSASLIVKPSKRKLFISRVFILPWIFGVLILSVFAISIQSWAWLAYLIGMGLIVLPIFGNRISKRRYKLVRYREEIFRWPYPKLIFIVVLILLWLADFFSKTQF
ncbi:MAG: hypothetical protein JW729_03530 [Bacteroidales bacterium]|nr:hypothetical protein [Bacteroidales bacterium]